MDEEQMTLPANMKTMLMLMLLRHRELEERAVTRLVGLYRVQSFGRSMVVEWSCLKEIADRRLVLMSMRRLWLIHSPHHDVAW